MADEDDPLMKCVPGAIIKFHWQIDSEIYTARIIRRRHDELHIRYLDTNETDEIELNRSALQIIEVLSRDEGYGNRIKAEPEVKLETCICCCEEREFFSVASCGHSVCGRCAIKLRWNFDRTPRNHRERNKLKNCIREDGYKCPVCREATYKNLIITRGTGHRFEDFNLPDLFLDKSLHVYFTKFEHRKYFNQIRRYFCPICNDNIKKHVPRSQWMQEQLKLKSFYSLGKLNYHLKREHRNIFLCDVCLKRSKLFLDEAQIFMGKQTLLKHKKKGDIMVNGKLLPRHPKCNFCNEEFFDNEEFLGHMRDKHFSCPYCEGDKLIFYEKQESLRNHFLGKHFLCEWCSPPKGEEDEEGMELVAFENVLDFRQHRRVFHFEQLDKTERKGNLDINRLFQRKEETAIKGAGVQEYCIPCYDLARQTEFNAQERQRKQWEVQAKIEQEHHKREIRSILGDRRIRSIPDYKSEEVPEREFKLHEIVHKTFKEKVKIEYHQLTYDCYRVGELSAARFFKSFRMLWNPGNEVSTWVEPLMLIISIDSNAQRRRDLYECYKRWMQDRNSDDHVKIWYFPEYEGLEIPDFQLLQMQLRRIKEKDQFPDLVEVKYANISGKKGVWKRDPTMGRGRGMQRRGRRSPNPGPMVPPPGRGRRIPSPNFAPMPRNGFPPNARGHPVSRPKRERPAMPASQFPALPTRSSPAKKKPIPQRAPPPSTGRPANIIQKPPSKKQKKKTKDQPKPKAQTKENRIIHESTEPKPANKGIEDLTEKFTDIDLVGIMKPTRWDGIIPKLCQSSLKVLSELTSSGGDLELKIESVALEELAIKVLKNTPQIENVLHHTNIGVFGQNLSSRVDMIRCFTSENDYEPGWVEESLRQIHPNILYTFTYFLFHARTKCIDLRNKKAKPVPAAQPAKKKKGKKKKKMKMSLAAFRR